MIMDIEKLQQKYHNVSREELEKIRETTLFSGLAESVIESSLRLLHDKRENLKLNGKDSVIVGPLVHVTSVHFQPYKKLDHGNELLYTYGRVYLECRDTSSGNIFVHDLYNHVWDDAQVLGPSGFLTLTSPIDLSWPCMPLHCTRLVGDVRVGGKDSGYISCAGHGHISCAQDTNDLEHEHVRSLFLRNELGELTLRYIAMPFGVCAHVEVRFFFKQYAELDEESCSSLNVRGKIIARYGNTYGGYDSGYSTLFEKQSNEFQQVGFDLERRSLIMSRSWVGLPVYSSLILDVDLSEFGSERRILKETLEFRVENKDIASATFIVDDFLINLSVTWISPRPQGTHSETEDECSDDGMSLQGSIDDDSNDEQMKEPDAHEDSPILKRPWRLGVHQSVPFSCAMVEIFSIFIGREELKPLQVYGFVEVSSDVSTFYFKKEATNALWLVEGRKTLPVLDKSFIYDDCEDLKMKIDLKDVGRSLHIKGYVDWDSKTLEFGTKWLNKQLCSIVEGEHGFAAVHYSIFPEAVQAHVGFLCLPKNNATSFPKVYGSIVAQYKRFDYSSQYNKDYYRIVLFQRNQEDSIELSEHGVISLSRSMVAVPLNSSLIIDVNLWSVDGQVLLHTVFEILIGEKEKT